MTASFDASTLATLGDAKEVAIRTQGHPKRSVIIWVVVVGQALFARSFRGARGQWYVDACADDHATLELGDRRWPVRSVHVTDKAVIEAVSQAYLRKYADSPYAAEMVRAEVLETTLRLDPG